MIGKGLWLTTDYFSPGGKTIKLVNGKQVTGFACAIALDMDFIIAAKSLGALIGNGMPHAPTRPKPLSERIVL